ncbi:hypothetical protein GCM10010394_29520 [Streptomyces crystallinus]|uniref:Uncharacterized protein n=1 Tax=Streptomyces crystallinus TaxID=68191 RepID=A0ABN1FUF7_9ACTN
MSVVPGACPANTRWNQFRSISAMCWTRPSSVMARTTFARATDNGEGTRARGAALGDEPVGGVVADTVWLPAPRPRRRPAPAG